MIAGNKIDLADEGREIFVEDVKDWVDQEYRQNRWLIMELFNLINMMYVYFQN